MNFIAATVEHKSAITDPITIYGLEYCGADAAVPGTGSNAEVRLRALCYNREGAKLSPSKNGNKAIVLCYWYNYVSDDPANRLDLIITTIETNIPQRYVLQSSVLGNAFFGSDEIKERKNNNVAVKIGTSLDNSDVVTWLFMETHESRKKNLQIEFVRDALFVFKATLREYRKDDLIVPYRAIVVTDFTTRKDRDAWKESAN